ncbi:MULTISPECIES: thioesterase II family protein [Micromonospora]|uniref:thioesterase II family protein n=1 Tax=Micromonospora TaxID=1873 RepID=UPI001AE9F7D9|nr:MULTISPECIES: alpha/beta fold hydrolase [unclassified Micromonospora]MBP1780683.1 surfactin synthase thioesterase subunit [Micromonospora sp. HB375]MDH6468907.1 medium-chain acyl-[acyl-carrier-protein] hydrolase [Micromonospora sp. H404/HB375]
MRTDSSSRPAAGLAPAGRSPERSAPFRIYYLTHAGGTGAEFSRSVFSRGHIDLVGVRYPGRGGRWREPDAGSVDDMVTALLAELPPSGPFGFFGHSMGALLAYEMTRKLVAEDREPPRCLWLSACPPPHLPRPEPPLAHLADADFLRAVAQRHGAVPQEVLDEPALAAVIVPPLRADYRRVEEYRFRPGPALTVPVHVLYGRDDVVSMERLEAWGELTESEPTLHGFPGGHFYLNEHRAAVLQLIERTISF